MPGDASFRAYVERVFTPQLLKSYKEKFNVEDETVYLTEKEYTIERKTKCAKAIATAAILAEHKDLLNSLTREAYGWINGSWTHGNWIHSQTKIPRPTIADLWEFIEEIDGKYFDETSCTSRRFPGSPHCSMVVQYILDRKVLSPEDEEKLNRYMRDIDWGMRD